MHSIKILFVTLFLVMPTTSLSLAPSSYSIKTQDEDQDSLPMKDCGSVGGKVTSITLDPPPKGACTFPKGTNVTAIVDLVTNEVANQMNVVCKGQVVVWVPFKLPDPNACDQGVTCPTAVGKEYTFKTVIPILKEYPSLRLVVQLEFQDEKGADVICVQFPGEIC